MPPTDRLARRLQQGALLLVLFLLPVSKAAVEIGFGLLLFGWLLEHAPARWRGSVWREPGARRVAVALALFAAACALSILGSAHPAHGWRALVSKTLEYLFFLVIAADVVAARPRIVVWVLAALMGSSLVAAFDGIAQELLGKSLLRGRPLYIYARMTGPYENPGDLAAYLAVVIPIVGMQVACGPRWRRWLAGALLALLAGCMIRVESSGAWFGLLAGLAVLVWAEPAVRPATLTAGAVFVIAGAAWLQRAGHLADVATLSDVGTKDRWFMWASGWRMFLDRPILGHGLNTFMENYLRYWVGGEQVPRYAHNCYLQTAAETGVVGLGAFLWLLGSLAACWRRGIARLQQPEARAALIGISAGLAAFLLQAAVDTSFYSLRQAALFWTLAGVACGLSLGDTILFPGRK